MKSTMDYGANTYGNTGNAASYGVKLTRRAAHGDITIAFVFDKPADGRGVGSSRGEVRRVTLALPRQTAQALSHALQLALTETASTELQFRIDEDAAK